MYKKSIEFIEQNYKIIFYGFSVLFAITMILFFLPAENSLTGCLYSIIILSSLLIIEKIKYSSIHIDVIFIILILLYALRNKSAIDDPSYERIYNLTDNTTLFESFSKSGVERGYLFINWLFNLLNLDYIFVQIFFSVIPIALILYTIKKYSEFMDKRIVTVLFISLFYFQMLAVALSRMFVSMSIVFFAIMFLFSCIDNKNKRNINSAKYLALIIFASLFHMTALVMIPFVVFMLIDKSEVKKYCKILLISAIVLLPVFFLVIGYVIAPLLGQRYESYTQIGAFSIRLSSFDTLPMLIYCFLLRKYIPKEHKNKFYIACLFVALSSVVSIYSSMVSLGRLIFYFNLGLMIILAMTSKYSRNKIMWLINNMLFTGYAVVYVYYTQFLNESHIGNLFPYQNLFFII